MSDAPTEGEPLHLFEGFGIELEYMIVDRQTLNVAPIADRVLAEANGGVITGELERGALAWSNELVLHVLELKANGPAPSLAPLGALFQSELDQVNRILAPLGGRILPGGMHPWMDPQREMKLWPHEYSAVYEAFDKVFDCRGHGWANLQSMHINLPFAGDEELGRLHAAIRLLLPILPALAASSPIVEGRATGMLDTRLEVYRHNAKKIPSVSGRVIPEPVFTTADYQALLRGIYRDIAPYDPEGVLQHEFLNARGAIARFDRNAIEIRVLDVQEHPAADLAVAELIVAVLRALVAERWVDFASQRSWQVGPLAEIFLAAVKDGEEAKIDSTDYLAIFGYPSASSPVRIGDLWCWLTEQSGVAVGAALETILDHGPLARRILNALGPEFSEAQLHAVYAQVADCAAMGRSFDPA